MQTVKEIWKQKNFMFKLGLVMCLAWVLIAVFASVLAPFDPIRDQDMLIRFQPPSGEHFFGTDSLGRDVFSRPSKDLREPLLINRLEQVLERIHVECVKDQLLQNRHKDQQM